MRDTMLKFLILFCAGTLFLVSCSEQNADRSDAEGESRADTEKTTSPPETGTPGETGNEGAGDEGKEEPSTAEKETREDEKAAEEKPERVRFSKGTTGTELKGTIEGYEVKEYLVGASKGQQLEATLNSDNRFAFFVVDHIATNMRIFDGNAEGSETVFTDLPHDGDYRFTVLMPRSEARRNGVAHYTLEMHIR